jgi:type IV pilus assembly protein PilE
MQYRKAQGNKDLYARTSSMVGFTLIELMIVIGIVAIVAAIAIPSYTNQTEKAYRADAKAALMQMASAMERFRTINNTYIGTGASNRPVATFFEDTAPLGAAADRRLYDLFIYTPNANEYVLVASPKASERMGGDWHFAVAHTGAKRHRNGAINNSNFAASTVGWDVIGPPP